MLLKKKNWHVVTTSPGDCDTNMVHVISVDKAVLYILQNYVHKNVHF